MTKTIQLNPQFLSKNADKATRKIKDKKEKPNTLVQPNKLRNDLLKRIKDYQSKSEGGSSAVVATDTNTENILEFTDEFNQSLHFLQDLSNKKDNNFRPSKTRKNQKSYEVEIELPDEMKDTVSPPTFVADAAVPTAIATVPSAPHAIVPSATVPAIAIVPAIATMPAIVTVPAIATMPAIVTATQPTNIAFKPSIYSSMKNGSKPTYRELNKPMITIEDKPIVEESDNSKMLEKIKSDYKKSNTTTVATAATPKRIKRTTRTCKYRLGKLGNKVSVLIKDYKTRKNIQNECYKLEKTNIIDIKNILRKKNLLKVGSVADEAVLREMYEQCILAGDIQNNNKETLIHNFLTK